MYTNNETILFNAIITSAQLRKEVDCRTTAATRAYATTEEAVDKRQAFAASCLESEEATAAHYAPLVSASDLLAIANSVVEDTGLVLDLAGLRLNQAVDGYHALGLPSQPSAVAALTEAYNAASATYDTAIANLKAVKAFLANR